MRGKILIKDRGGRKQKVKIYYLGLVVGLIISATMPKIMMAQANSCPDVRVVFARGSGGERWTDKNYLEYKKTIEGKLATTTLRYEFIDLDYPAVGIDDVSVLVGAYVGAGNAYEFGASVNKGVENLVALVNGTSCPGTKYVVGGYSQGAMVVSKALSSLAADRVVYAATFGDPKLYLPEGQGIFPVACRGKNLSDYRMYVPDCQAYKGLLGAYIPYEPVVLAGKVGTWCNKRDIFCSSHLSISDHVSYVSDNLYEDAARVIFDKICRAFGVKNTISSPRDTAILVDTSGSMRTMMQKYRNEVMRLARETYAANGRVALYYYNGENEYYPASRYCDFNECTLGEVEAGLNYIQNNCAGKTPDLLMTASWQTMADLRWRQGATKSLVILTDAGFSSPDRRGMTFDVAVEMSKKIDPVNFYIVTTPELKNEFEVLAKATDGDVAIEDNEVSAMFDKILARYDTLPRVEETENPEMPPVLTVLEAEISVDSATIRFTNTGTRVLIALNGAVLGIAEGDSVTIGELNAGVANTVTLTPLGEDVRGEAVEVVLATGLGGISDSTSSKEGVGHIDGRIVKTPNTGKN